MHKITMKGLGLTLIVCLATYLLVLTQALNQNPNAIIINALNKQSLITNYKITGLMTTTIAGNNYTIRNSVPVSIKLNNSKETYTFDIPMNGKNYSIALIIENKSYLYCENNKCSSANLSKLTAQRFAGISATNRISQLLNEHLISLKYKGIKSINGILCDLINAKIAVSSESFINFIIDGKVLNLSVDFCLDRNTGLPVSSTINAVVPNNTVTIEFKASELKT